MASNEVEVFTVRATRCTRCGGILLSEYGLKHGMGHVCKAKFDAEHAPIDENQLSFFEEEKDDGRSEESARSN